MTNSELKSYIASTRDDEKALFLSRLIHTLTIGARWHYGEENAEAKLMKVNEMIHLSSCKLRDVLTGTTKQYPDDVFVDILFETVAADESDLQTALRWTLDHSRV